MQHNSTSLTSNSGLSKRSCRDDQTQGSARPFGSNRWQIGPPCSEEAGFEQTRPATSYAESARGIWKGYPQEAKCQPQTTQEGTQESETASKRTSRAKCKISIESCNRIETRCKIQHIFDNTAIEGCTHVETRCKVQHIFDNTANVRTRIFRTRTTVRSRAYPEKDLVGSGRYSRHFGCGSTSMGLVCLCSPRPQRHDTSSKTTVIAHRNHTYSTAGLQ